MAGEVDTITSNVSRLSIREDGASIWLTLKPKSFAEFGAEVEKEENQVIEPGRNREKEVAVGVSAPGGFKLNFTAESFGHFAEGVFLVNERRTPESGGRFGTGSPTAVGTGFDLGEDAAAAGFLANQLVYAEFWDENVNNGLFVVTGTTGNVVEVPGLTVEGSPPADAYIKVVGYQFPTADLDVVVSGGNFPQLQSTANLITDLGRIPGEWVSIGGGTVSTEFAAAHNNGVARVGATAAGALTLDLTSGGDDLDTAMVSETGTGLDIRIFYGDFFRNVSAIGAEFNAKVWELERTLGIPNPVGSPGVTQAEYLLEALLNTVTIPAPAKKVLEFDVEFLAKDGTTATGEVGDELRTDGDTLLDLHEADAFNTSSDKLRNRLYIDPPQSDGNAVPARLFKFLTEQTVTISNGAVVEDAHGEFGALEIVPGDHSFVSEMTAHFGDVAQTRAVRNNSDIGYQLGYINPLRGRNAGVLFDCPRGSLGNGRNNVERNASIKTPLRFSGNISAKFGYTSSFTEFPFLP